MALTNCNTTLASDLLKNCSDVVVGGLEKIAYLINREDVDIEATKATLVSGSNNIYSGLILKTGKKGYKCSNITNEVTTKVDGTFNNKFQHTISGALLDDGDVAGGIIEALSSNSGEFVAVVEYKYKDLNRSVSPGSSAFHIIGLDVPLTSEGQEIVNDKSSEDTDGGWSFALSCTDGHARTLWFAETYTATKALFDALGTEVEGD